MNECFNQSAGYVNIRLYPRISRLSSHIIQSVNSLAMERYISALENPAPLPAVHPYLPMSSMYVSRINNEPLPWLCSLTGDNVAVCHIGIMRVILALAWGWEFTGPAPFRIKRNRLYVVDLEQMRPEAEPVRLIPREAGS